MGSNDITNYKKNAEGIEPSAFLSSFQDFPLNYRKLHWSFFPNFPSSKLHEKFGVSFQVLSLRPKQKT
jgi:hypothetical protein